MFLQQAAIHRNRLGVRPVASTPAPTEGSALLFLENGVTGYDIRLVWDGANLLPREEHTAVWKINHFQQTGYYSVAWHSPYVNGASTPDAGGGGWDGGFYSYGTHPYPCDGTYSTAGNAIGETFDEGTDHYFEIASNGLDYISIPQTEGAQASMQVIKGQWYVQARTSRLINGDADVEMTFWPDLENNPNFYIRRIKAASALSGGAGGYPSDPAFYFGNADWTGPDGVAGGYTPETPGGSLRGIKLFDAFLNQSDMTTEALAESNTPQTAAGLANVWYTNINPTVADVTDKSGAGHNPRWANSNRPDDQVVSLAA